MSADLFAEFASDANHTQGNQTTKNPQLPSQPQSSFSFFDSFNTAPAPIAQTQPQIVQHQFQNSAPSNTQELADDDNDDWGDFEGGSSTVGPAPPAFDSTPKAQPSLNTGIDLAFFAQDPFAYNANPTDQPPENTWQQAPIIKAKRSADPRVLFDAEDDLGDDDDFGDFEGTDTKAEAPAPAPAISSSALVDLLGNMSVSQPEHAAVSTRKSNVDSKFTSSIPMKNNNQGAFGGTSRPKHSAKVITPIAPAGDDAWDTFDDWEASIPTKLQANSSSRRASKSIEPADNATSPAPILSPSSDDVRSGELPPTNVPPPGVLLSLFPSLFTEAQEKLFKPMAAQTLPMRNKLMAEPTTINYLQGYLMLANVAAHIIAGRKLRWKRDQHLSQGMRIGPASSRATSGMKLTGIDKGENMKEEREASDVMRVWKDQVGRLRHIVSGANQIRAGVLGAVPDLQETKPIKTLKQSEGGIPARQPCMLCGLRREERVTATDMATDDSFGEWWIDQVNMHRGCRNFWNQHKDKLRGR
ncbi:hypothetical protein BDU57DRAFT_527175 [Ampelomyces quisqualis]|uniref:Serine/threonine-protein kinase ppk6 n=1 Tax=Ampelomyces quisqualis TaxID=50730 RepID=A0A6A5QUE9_AMPQU|nr:hypothetical protein BDU57DRAFT_527175 [Ampelomyces quisqualis]